MLCRARGTRYSRAVNRLYAKARGIATAAVAAAGLLWAGAPAAAQMSDRLYCQILDQTDEPLWQVGAGYVTREKVRAPWGNDFGLVETQARSGIAYLPTAIGDFDLRGRYEGMFFAGSGGLDLPDFAGQLNLDARWIYRTEFGLAGRVGVEPGFYSDFEDLTQDDFFIPVKLAAIQALTPELSGLVGLDLYPGFDRTVYARAGVRWNVYDTVLVDLFYPESRVSYAPSDLLRFYAGMGIRSYPEFQLADGDERKRLRYDETRWYGGARFAMSDATHFFVEGGRSVDRSIRFEEAVQSGSVDNAFFCTVGLGGVF
jgi:hypothetical protein